MSSSTPKTALLLLPPSPQPSSYSALKAAYGATIFTVLRELSSPATPRSKPAVLTVAVTAPLLASYAVTPRAALYARTQRLISGIYKLITLQSAQLGLPTNPSDTSGVDARLVLVSWTPISGHNSTAWDDQDPRLSAISPEAEMQGPITNVQTLARSGRKWDVVYAVQTEEGDEILKRFRAAAAIGRGRELLGAGLDRQDNFEVRQLRGGITNNSEGDTIDERISPSDPAAHEMKRHWHVAVGGTFDHLHIGHKLLLTMTAFMIEGASAAAMGSDDGELELDPRKRTVTIGITGDELLKNKKFAEHLESWDQRQQAVQDFLTSILDFSPAGTGAVRTERKNEPGLHGRAVRVHLPARLTLDCVEIVDAFGPTITDESVSALVVSAETRQGGPAINVRRGEKGWEALECFEVDVLDAGEDAEAGDEAKDNFQAKLSSTQIRQALS